jgi:PAS domain S-box-containing protein
MHITSHWIKGIGPSVDDFLFLGGWVGVASILSHFLGNNTIQKMISAEKIRIETEAARRETEESMRSILSSMKDLVFVLDKNDCFLVSYQPEDNPDYYAPPESYLGKSYKEVLPPQVTEKLGVAIQKVKATGKVQELDYSLKMNGRESWFNAVISMRKGPSGEFDGVTAVVRNITEREKMKEKIHAQELEKAEFEMANRILTTFSDYLRNKLCALPQLAEMLSEKNLDELTNNIKTKGLHGDMEFVDDLRVYATIGMSSTKGVFRTLGHIRALVQPLKHLDTKETEIGKVVSEAAEAANVTFTKSSDPLVIELNEEMIQSALTFFFESAAKYDSNVKIEFHKKDSGLKIVIADIGERDEGLTLDVLRDPPFAHGKTFLYEEYLELSLGLKYIEAHDGKVEIESDKNTGTTVSIWLPIKVKKK